MTTKRRYPLAHAALEGIAVDRLQAALVSMAADVMVEQQLNRPPTDEELARFLREEFEE